ncbi:MAG: type II secretion system GspH family protein [Oscillospiraceae bacterium]|nr:type II secretion system GspH family protein [Oscillospiraceae bacterium]
MNIRRNKEKGITLIALIITVIVLLILAGVAIFAITGNNGLIEKVQSSVNESNAKAYKEQVDMDISDSQIQFWQTNKESVTSPTDLNFQSMLTEKGYTVTDNGDGTLTVEKDGGKVIINADFTTTVEGVPTKQQEISLGKTDGSWNGTVNTPILSSGMTAVAWDVNNDEITPNTQNEWYNYVAQVGPTDNGGTSKWANVKTTNGSYLVWIPRYEYKITSGEYGVGLALFQAGTIDVKFIPVTQTTADSGYKIPPAFTNNPDNGGWDKELAGFWISKYEASNDGNNNLKVIPDAVAWCSIGTDDIFTICQKFSTDNNLTGMDSHMMKNSEWGALAYLTQSQYGRNGTGVTVNNYAVNWISKTGYAGGSVSATQDTTGDSSYLYNTTQGVLASTTGNITGVYDTSGCQMEYVAAYVDNGDPSLIACCSKLINAAAKYKDIYAVGVTDSSTDNFMATSSKYGDALYETMNWFNVGGCFPRADCASLVRRRW